MTDDQPSTDQPGGADSVRHRLHEIIFEADTTWGKAFDVALFLVIVLSVGTVMMESVEDFAVEYGAFLRVAEWVFTVIFTIEYLLRISCVRSPGAYMRSFFGLVDLLSILPTYVSLFIPGAQSLLVIRVLRLLRVFRVLKLVHFSDEASVLMRALLASRRKITVFLGTVMTLVVIMGTLMYLVEGGEGSVFTSIPRGIYWAVVTLTTVGYGDIAPVTPLGQFIAGCVMIMGYAIIAVPTGIVTVEIAKASRSTNTQSCRDCSFEGHDDDARYCKRCGTSLGDGAGS